MFVTEEQKQKIEKMLVMMEQEAEHYDQDSFPSASNQYECGGEMCCAGFIIAANDPEQYAHLLHLDYLAQDDSSFSCGVSWDMAAMQVLGLTKVSFTDRIKYSLFGTHESWPEPFAEQYANTSWEGDAAYASKEYHQKLVAIARARWEHFIETGE